MESLPRSFRGVSQNRGDASTPQATLPLTELHARHPDEGRVSRNMGDPSPPQAPVPLTGKSNRHPE
ncbi:hypothetical protein [Cecembia sp.]|uniref:hypothetical protein n=1 Tax=Cecembia sp. TaxID=1898110 RepID=UPI0025BBC5E5|nr:hypothetical protein [Cecembia sp.]